MTYGLLPFKTVDNCAYYETVKDAAGHYRRQIVRGTVTLDSYNAIRDCLRAAQEAELQASGELPMPPLIQQVDNKLSDLTQHLLNVYRDADDDKRKHIQQHLQRIIKDIS